VTSIEGACDCDILITTTPSRKPIVKGEWVNAGTHINAIGADAPGKQELESRLIKNARVFVDDREQAFHSGEVNVPLSTGIIAPEEIAGTIGEVITGKVKGRIGDEITIFDSTGLAIQDIATASIVLKRATEEGLGLKVKFFDF
jgi:alanine dehydrogenase